MNEKTEERPESRTQTAGTENKERKRTDPQRQAQKENRRGRLLMLIPFCAFMYLIFGGTDAGEEPGTGGINTTIPDGKVQRIEASRQKAAEKVEAEALAGEKIQSLGEAVSLPEPDSALRITTSLPAGGIDRSQDAHREMARQIESFYSDPAPDPHTADLERELERLRGELTAKEAAESLARPIRWSWSKGNTLWLRSISRRPKRRGRKCRRQEAIGFRSRKCGVPRVGSYRRWPVLRRIPRPPQRTPRRVIPDSTPR